MAKNVLVNSCLICSFVKKLEENGIFDRNYEHRV